MAIKDGNGKVTYAGRVVKVYHDNYRAMSDVYTLAEFALVHEDDGSFKVRMVNANFELDVSGRHAEVDADEVTLAAYSLHLQKIADHEEARRKEQIARFREEERNRPTVGKQMIVFKGRKVPLGTVGTVAHVSGSGDSALLKPDNAWQDRKTDGVWVPIANLKAR